MSETILLLHWFLTVDHGQKKITHAIVYIEPAWPRIIGPRTGLGRHLSHGYGKWGPRTEQSGSTKPIVTANIVPKKCAFRTKLSVNAWAGWWGMRAKAPAQQVGECGVCDAKCESEERLIAHLVFKQQRQRHTWTKLTDQVHVLCPIDHRPRPVGDTQLHQQRKQNKKERKKNKWILRSHNTFKNRGG